MEVSIRLLISTILLLFVEIVVSLTSTHPLNSTHFPVCHPTQRNALLQFKNHFVINKPAFFNENCFNEYSKTESWREGINCCLWEGVECDKSSGNVITLYLSCAYLYGQFPTNTSLFQLYHLQTLDLSNNDFNGSPIPSELGRLVNLKHLHISSANFSGMIPSQISHLSNLIELQIEGGYFDFEKDHLIFDSLTFQMLANNLTRLQTLYLRHVDMTAVNLNSFLNLSASLDLIYLFDCLLRGNFPVDVLRFVNLTAFYASNNPKLTITLPNSNWTAPLILFGLSNVSFSTEHFNSLANLKSLTSLYLDNCGLTGEIPTFLSNLKQLEDLSLSDNNLKGQVPNLFGNLTMLNYLSLGLNNLEGHLPSIFFSHPQLTWLDLSYNELVSLPVNVTGFSKLVYLLLNSNKLTGSIPSWLFNVSSLTCLDLSNNNLSIPTHNAVDINWPNLKYLFLLSCNMTEFPMLLRTLDNLKLLDLSNNNIHGDIPKWMMNLGKETLLYLNLSQNSLTGTLQLPWQHLQVLDIHYNMFQGLLPIPPPNLTYILISKNKFSGVVSSLYCNLSSLEILDLSYNNLSGTIPSCLGNLTAVLLVLNLRRNNFHGTIPTTYAETCTLRNLNLQGNQLEGKIPSSLVNCKELEVLDFGHNMFNDEFPEWLSTLPMLRVLILRSNKLHGLLPNFTANDSFSKLQVLDLSTNSFFGNLPNLQNLQAMANVDASARATRYLGTETNFISRGSYDYPIDLSIKGYIIEIQKIFHFFTSIDLSNNSFEGEIPNDIGKLFSLKGLNLSHNILKGRVPSSVGNLKNLEWLDLSSNKLIGEIPTTLAEVTSLASLNLSNNQLVGQIPKGKQFNTFTIESYKGNLGLCGYPLSRKCRDEESQPPMTSMDDAKTCFFKHEFGWQSVAIGYGSGMVFGVVLGYIMFRYRRPRWLLLIIEDKLRLRPQRKSNSWRRNTRRNNMFG